MTPRQIGAMALGLAAGATLAYAGVANAATVLTTGTLTGPSGAPALGEVRVYAWPGSSKAMDLPAVADVPGREGEWTFTGFVSAAGGHVQVCPPTSPPVAEHRADVGLLDRSGDQPAARPSAGRNRRTQVREQATGQRPRPHPRMGCRR